MGAVKCLSAENYLANLRGAKDSPAKKLAGLFCVFSDTDRGFDRPHAIRPMDLL